MNGKELAVIIRDILDKRSFGNGIQLEKIRLVRTYEEASVLLFYPGVVINMEDGSEFQMTIVKSK